MSIFKDWADYNRGFALRYKIKSALSLREWHRIYKWRKQRSDRGWSDRDTWGAGEHVARVTAEMLQYLENNSTVDFQAWFDMNKKSGEYNRLQEIIDDINAYLDFTEKSWADDLTPIELEQKTPQGLSIGWYDKNGIKQSEKQITAKIGKHRAQEKALYEKATKAMSFFGENFAVFWD